MRVGHKRQELHWTVSAADAAVDTATPGYDSRKLGKIENKASAFPSGQGFTPSFASFPLT